MTTVTTSSLLPRIIVCLDVDKGRVVKGTNFKQLRDMGDPVELALDYEAQGADELVFLDISATSDNRPTALKLVSEIASNLSIPFTVGGGLKKLDDVKAFLDAGADKVALNTTAVLIPEIIDQTALAYGSQCVVVAIDVNQQDGKLPIYINGGRKLVDNDFFEFFYLFQSPSFICRGNRSTDADCLHMLLPGDEFGAELA